VSSSRNSDESCHLGVRLFHDNAPAHKSLVAQQLLCNCQFVQLNHPGYSLDLARSNYFLIRNLKYRLRGTWDRLRNDLYCVGWGVKLYSNQIVEPELYTMNHWRWLWRHGQSQYRKYYFQGINSWEQKLKICTDVAWEYVKKQHVWYSMLTMLTFYSQVAKLFDRLLSQSSNESLSLRVGKRDLCKRKPVSWGLLSRGLLWQGLGLRLRFLPTVSCQNITQHCSTAENMP